MFYLYIYTCDIYIYKNPETVPASWKASKVHRYIMIHAVCTSITLHHRTLHRVKCGPIQCHTIPYYAIHTSQVVHSHGIACIAIRSWGACYCAVSPFTTTTSPTWLRSTTITSGTAPNRRSQKPGNLDRKSHSTTPFKHMKEIPVSHIHKK